MPVVTRAKSGKLPVQRQLDQATSDVEAIAVSTSTNHQETSLTPRPAKRGKTVASSNAAPTKKQSKGLSKRKQGLLSVLPTLPLDILFEIFSHLAPADLLHLSRVSKSFRQTLLVRSRASLWKQSWENYDLPGIPPPCPSGWSEPAWIGLLFGGPFCQTCGARTANEIDFCHRRRACSSCLSKSLICGDDAVKLVSDPELLTWMPKARVHPRNSRGVLLPDVCYLTQDVLNLQSRIITLIEGLQPAEKEETLDSFQDSQAQSYDDLYFHVTMCENWTRSLRIARALDISWKKEKRRAEVEQRCVAKGYTAADFAAVASHREIRRLRGDNPVSDRVFARIFPHLQEGLDTAKSKRLWRERVGRKERRAELIHAQYAEYWTALHPHSLVFLPETVDFDRFSRIVPLLEDDLESDDDFKARVQQAIQDSIEEIEARAVRLKTLVLSSLPPATLTDSAPCSPFDIPRELQLAKNVYTRNPQTMEVSLYLDEETTDDSLEYYALYGLEILTARFDYDDCDVPSLNASAQAMVLGMLKLLGLDPDTTTTADLYSLDPQFFCHSLSCPRRPRSWRAHLDHLLEIDAKKDPAQCDHGSELLSEAGRRQVADGASAERGWGCSHCTAHYTVHPHYLPLGPSLDTVVWMRRGEVTKHLLEKHGIDKPRQELDFYYHPYGRYSGNGKWFFDLEE